MSALVQQDVTAGSDAHIRSRYQSRPHEPLQGTEHRATYILGTNSCAIAARYGNALDAPPPTPTEPMSTSSQDRAETKLSERLRALKDHCVKEGECHSVPNETAHWLIVGAVDEIETCIAQAEALEAREQSAQPQQPVAMIHNDYDASVACSNCGTDGGFSTYDDLDWARCCPGCGRPISEQVDAKGNRTPHPLYAAPVPSQQQTNGITLDPS